jgi:hypothetical protein
MGFPSQDLKEGAFKETSAGMFQSAKDKFDDFMLRKKLLGISLLETSNKKCTFYTGANKMIYDKALHL